MTQPNPKIEDAPVEKTKEQMCLNALKCLYVCVEEQVARDINTIVWSYVGELQSELSIANAKVRELETRVGICVDALKRINKLRVEYDKDGNEMHRAISLDVLANQGMLSMGFKMREDAELLAIREVSGEMEEAGIRARDLIHSSLCGHQDCRVECTELTFTLKRANELKMKE